MISWWIGGARIGGGGDGEGDGDGVLSRRVSRVSVILIRSSLAGDGVRSRRSTYLSRTTRTGEGERSLILSLVSITLARRRSGGVKDRSRSIILSRTRTGLGDRCLG